MGPGVAWSPPERERLLRHWRADGQLQLLAAARGELLRRVGWDADAQGLFGAPPIQVLVGEEAHVTVLQALRYLGLGHDRVTRVGVDANGAMGPLALEGLLLAAKGPVLLGAKAGNVNTGACDPLEAIGNLAAEHGAWLHVDGAFGLWAAASPRFEGLVAGRDRADSGLSMRTSGSTFPTTARSRSLRHQRRYRVRWRSAQRISPAAITDSRRSSCPRPPAEGVRSPCTRRCDIRPARRRRTRRAMLRARDADGLPIREGGLEVLNDVVLNQVLVAGTPEHLARVQADGECWLGGTAWRGRHTLRVSFSNWSTTEDDVRRTARAILNAAN